MNLRSLLSLLSIQPKGFTVTKFKLNWAQEEYITEVERQLETRGRVRIITLKARQIGISTVTEGLLFNFAMTFPNYRGLVVAHKTDGSYNLFNITKLYWKTYPFKQLYTPRYESKRHLEWVENNSNIQVATAGSPEAGRSSTIHFLHASEYAFWPDARTTMLALRQTIPNIPGSVIVIESTANGVGNAFHDEWYAAKNGDTEYVPLFFPWWKHPEYMASAIGVPYESLGVLDEEEQTLKSAFGLSDDRLMWRRWAIKNLADNDLKKFNQEYPATDEEAFLSTGTNVFPLNHLRACYEPMPGIRGLLRRDGNRVEFIENPSGPLTIYRYPSSDPSWGQYYVAGDPTRTTRGDFASAQVINRNTLEQVAVWRGRIDPGSFAEELFKLGLYFNEAWVSTEKEGPGELTIGKLLGMEYPKVWRTQKIDKTPGKVTGDTFGWSTTAQTKHLAIGWLLKVMVDRNITIHHDVTFQECKNYVVLEDGTYGPVTKDGFDDCVMAMAIVITCHFLDDPVMAIDAASEDFQPNLTETSSAIEELYDEVEGLAELPWFQRAVGDSE